MSGSDASVHWRDLFSSRGDDSVQSESKRALLQRHQPQPKDYVQTEASVRNAIAGNPQIQSCYLQQSVPFATGTPLHADYPAMELAVDIIHLHIRNTLRTRGLLYSFNMNANAFDGLVTIKFVAHS